jgi:uncharacterized protein YbjT (DUF2867 family)
MDNILITGGTGTLGRAIIKQLAGLGTINIISSRDNAEITAPANIIKADLTDADSLKQVVSKANVIIHCASNPTNAFAVDLEGTRNLLNCINTTALKHFIYISIAGVDKSQFPYYVVKRRVEQLVEAAGIPFTILRATQFHDFVLYRMIKSFETDGVLTIPQGLKFQSVDITEVAAKVKELTLTTPTNDVITFAGPQIQTIEEMAATYLNISGHPGPLKTEKMEGERFDMLRSGINLCPDKAFGKITWNVFLTKLANYDQL